MNAISRSCLLLAVGAWAALAPSAFAQGDEVYQAIVKREYGTAVAEMTAIEKAIHDAKPDQYPPIEAKLLAVLAAPEATMPGKQFVCQMLKLVGSSKCIPAVSQLLTDEQLSHSARNVLLGLKDPAADAALRAALGKTQGKVRIGIINTLGDRQDAQALPALAALVNPSDEATSWAALNAIGKIGGAPAADTLDRLKAPAALQEAWAQACLRCAGSLAASDPRRAEKMALSLFEGAMPLPVRAGAFTALVQLQQDRAVPLIVKHLSANEPLLRRAAIAAVTAVPGNAATKAFARELAGLSPEGKVFLLGALASRGDAEGLTDTVNKLAADENPTLRQAAIKALGKLGNPTSVPVLTAALKDYRAEATRAMIELNGQGVIEALIKQCATGDAAARESLLGVLADRRQTEALPAFRQAATENDGLVRRAAYRALGNLGAAEDLTLLANLLLAKQDAGEQDAIAQAMAAIGSRLPDQASRTTPVLAALEKANAQAKVSLLSVLGALGGDRALQAVRDALTSGADVRKAAVRALADWRDPAPMPDLLTIARDEKDKATQILALRGYLKMVGVAGGGAEQKLQAYREAMTLATRPDEKKLVLNGLADVTHADSLKAVEPFLEDAALQREALIAYEKIAESLARREPALAREALQKVVEKTADAGLRNRAKAALDKIK